MARSCKCYKKKKKPQDFLLNDLQVFEDNQTQMLLSERDKANIKLTFWEQCKSWQFGAAVEVGWRPNDFACYSIAIRLPFFSPLPKAALLRFAAYFKRARGVRNLKWLVGEGDLMNPGVKTERLEPLGFLRTSPGPGCQDLGGRTGIKRVA